MSEHTDGRLYLAYSSEETLHMCIPWSQETQPGDTDTFGSCYGASICKINFTKTGVPTEERARANARRLAACWNACIGIPTEVLEQGKIKS